MGLVLPALHPARAQLEERGVECAGSAPHALRVGVINLMPSAEAYEPMLLEPLGRSAHWVEPIWIRLASHGYQSSDAAHLARHYRSFDEAGALDGLILTGAPVEELPFAEVRYFAELQGLLERARTSIPSTVGLCWGGMALAQLLGVGKVRFARKLFGVYPLEGFGPCAQSRHAGLDLTQLGEAEAHGSVRVLAGDTLVESTDGRYLMHLGHPEYTPARLRFEYLRDRELGRADVDPPLAVEDDASPSPLPHGITFFANWLAVLDRSRVGQRSTTQPRSA
ncbi:MAG TPA: homoserine O-succinyltransferase [Polyangiales bacterium]|nr:homoserine O-succinyltransferase [Polyangiales bacterium]